MTFRFGKGALPDGETIAMELGALLRRLKCHADFTEKRIEAIPIPFLSGFLASRDCSASDLRDHIYGIVGCVSNCPVRVNYSKPAYRVYLETARHVIQQTAKLDILTACKDWAPDRRERQAATMDGYSEHPISALMRQVLPPRPDLETMTLGHIELLLSAVKNPQFQLPGGDEYRKTLKKILSKLGIACLPSWVPQWH